MSHLQAPSLNSSLPTLADWIELRTLNSTRRRTSHTDVIGLAQIADDSKVGDSVEIDGRAEELMGQVFDELDRRAKAADSAYPFRLNRSGTALDLVPDGEMTDAECVYLFCLLVSEYRRKQMIAEAVFTPLAGTVEDLFQVCSTVAAAGLLRGPAKSFGSPRPDGSGFLDALRRVFEGGFREGKAESKPRPGVSSATKDGGIDIVAWNDFPDGLPSKLYLLGQCATGAQYPNKSVKVYIETLYGDWFTISPGSPAIEALFIPFTLDHHVEVRRGESPQDVRHGHYLSRARSLGVIIDRCRLAHLIIPGAAVESRQAGWVERAGELKDVRAWVDAVRTKMNT